jgi:tartrate-resistant acid phosphatase type 5
LVAKANDDGITRFFVVGDWGGLPVTPFDTPSEVAVADAMGRMGVKLNTTFQLALGDNFYYNGVKTVNDSRFQVQFYFVDKTKIIFEIFFIRILLNMYFRRQHCKLLGMF